jgi:lysophospholipase L1-like esterase
VAGPRRGVRLSAGRLTALLLALVLTAALGVPAAADQPSAQGSAQGSAADRGRGPRVLGLGDSVMAGTHCRCSGIVAGYAARERRRGRAPIVPVNLGTNGATTSSLLRELSSPQVLARVRRAKVVLIMVGANDLVPQLHRWESGSCPSSCFAPAVDAMGDRLGRVLAAIRSARAGRADPGRVLVIDYWNVFLDGHQTVVADGHAEVAWGRKVTRLANTAICAQSAAYGDRCVDIYHPFLKRDGDPTNLLAADGDHPNAKGDRVIVGRLVAATPRRLF